MFFPFLLTLATALVGGGGLTILGITVFGGPDYERYVAPADCHVQAKVRSRRGCWPLGRRPRPSG